VIFDSELNFVHHFKEKIHTAYSSGIIKTNFINIYDRHITFVYNFSQTITAIYYEDAFVMLYKSLVRSHLEYANSVGLWNTDRLDLIKDLKKVQMRATKLVINQSINQSVLFQATRPISEKQRKKIKNLTYKDRLKRLKLPTLK